jgi:hypothetical protein
MQNSEEVDKQCAKGERAANFVGEFGVKIREAPKDEEHEKTKFINFSIQM